MDHNGGTRADAIASAMDDIRSIDAAARTDGGPTRESVDAIRARLLELTSNRELFSLDAFPPPGPESDQRSCLYRIAQDDDDTLALYVNSSRGDVSTPPHNHTTWAVVVGFEGQEVNRFYKHSDDGGVEQFDEFTVEAGSGVAMLPDDLHSIHIEGAALNFHCYGRALETLDARQFYDRAKSEWRVFPAHTDIREARPGVAA